MAALPARIAGVEEIVMCTPGRNGSVPDPVLAAARICGVTEVHPIGGAHSVAAMAYGTESIPRVRKIVGPGGTYVTAAKLLVRNDCEIDFLAGPSEVLIIADKKANPRFLASDMLAQLEHDPLARAVLVSTSDQVIRETMLDLEEILLDAERSGIARRSAEKGAIFVTAPDLARAIEFANEYAPEHLLIDTRDPKAILGRIRNAGSVFLGSYSSVAFGDYCSGTNHILPTLGGAAMKSSLSVYDFVKMIPYQSISASGASALSPTVVKLARTEGLPAHADAAALRGRRSAKCPL
jgi:histidinol dehydrogenase